MQADTDRNREYAKKTTTPSIEPSCGLSSDIEEMISEWMVPRLVEEFLRGHESVTNKAEPR
jgi:hypothetical protein